MTNRPLNIGTAPLQLENEVSLIDRAHRWFIAACIVLGMVATLALVVTNPPYYSLQNGVPAQVATFATASPAFIQAHLVSAVAAAYLAPLSLLGMAWLAMRPQVGAKGHRSNWLASIAFLIVLIGMLPVSVFPAQDALTYDVVRIGISPISRTILQQYNNDGVMSYYSAMFLVGTILGPILIGIALWRARAVPIWAAVLITFGRLLTFLYPFLRDLPGIYIQLLSWTPLFIGSIPTALAVLNAPGTEAGGKEESIRTSF